MSEKIEELKRQYTDKYVVVDESRPELRRFRGMTGTIKTVNMNGRALVEFDSHNNIGWYDIELDLLKVIDKPLPKPEPSERGAKTTKGEGAKPAPAAKSAAAKSPTAKAPATGVPAAKAGPTVSPAAAPKMSVAEMLAAARAKPGSTLPPAAAANPPAAAAPVAKAESKKLSTKDILAAARVVGKSADAPPTAAQPIAEKPIAEQPVVSPSESGKPIKLDPKKMSVADMLAAARGGTAVPTVAPSPPTPAAKPVAPQPKEAKTERDSATPQQLSGRSTLTSTGDILAYCRKTDAK